MKGCSSASLPLQLAPPLGGNHHDFLSKAFRRCCFWKVGVPGLSRQAQGGKGAWHFPAAVAMQLEMGVGHLPQLPVFGVTGWRSLTTEELCEMCFLFFGSNQALMTALGSSSGQ